MGRLFPRRIVPSVLLGLAAVLDAHREHAHHAPLRVGRAEATRGCRVPLERRGSRRFSSHLVPDRTCRAAYCRDGRIHANRRCGIDGAEACWAGGWVCLGGG
jgi:hypothetical protein